MLLSHKSTYLVALLFLVVMAIGACSATEEAAAPAAAPAAPASAKQPAPAATAAAGQAAAPAATAAAGPVYSAPSAPAASSSGGPKYGGILIASNRGDIGKWDVMFTGTITVHNVVGSIYGPGNLIRPCREDVFFICDALSDKWESNSDFTEWTFHIRDNVTWHDGQPFTAKDAKWWIDLSINGVSPDRRPSNKAVDFGDVVSVDAVNDSTLKITLATGIPTYLAAWGNSSNEIAHPRHLMQPEIDAGNATVSPDDVGVVATGPFKFKEYRKGSVIKVRRNDKYWEKDGKGNQLPFLDGIDFPIIGDTNTMTAAFRAGRIDTTSRGTGYALTPAQMRGITKDLGDKAYFAGWDDTHQGIAINTSVAPWDDIRVRKALNLWYDRHASCEVILEGECVVVAMYAPNAPWYDKASEKWPGINPDTKEADRVESKRLLTEAGYPDGFKTSIMCRNVWISNCEFYEQQFRGFLGEGNVTLDIVDTATRDERSCAGDYAIASGGNLGADGPAPQAYYAAFASTNACATYGKHGDTKVDDMFKAAASAKTIEDRIEKTRALEKYIMHDKVYAIVTNKESKKAAFRSYMKGFVAPAVGQYNNTSHATVWLDK